MTGVDIVNKREHVVEVVDSVEFYTEETDTWSTLAAAPGLCHPRTAVLELRKPLRLIDVDAMFPKRAK